MNQLHSNVAIAQEVIKYEALVQQVELLAGGELTHGSARRLLDRGWGLYINRNDVARFMKEVFFCKDASIMKRRNNTSCLIDLYTNDMKCIVKNCDLDIFKEKELITKLN